MNGRIKVLKSYRNDTYAPKDAKIYRKKSIDSLVDMVKRRETGYYKKTDIWLYQALEKYSISGKNVVLIGSTSPWYESICLYYGASCTTIEYNKIISALRVIEWVNLT